MSYSLKDVTMACAMYAGWDSERNKPENAAYAAQLFDKYGFGDVEAMRFMAETAPRVNGLLEDGSEESFIGVPEYEVGEPLGVALFKAAAEAGDAPYFGIAMRALVCNLIMGGK